jgi:integrase
MIWIGATLGLRWSEVAGLRIGRLDLAGGKLSVVETIVRGIGGRNVFGPPKSRAGKRTMFMPAAIVTMLSAHLEQAGLAPADSDTLVFTDEAGGPLRYSNWRRRVWLPAAKAAGCEGAGFHDLRRLNATTLVVGGIDVKTAQVRLGHADPRMTLAIYASAPASVDRAAADVIGERFFGQDGKKSRVNPKAKTAKNLRAISAPSAPEEPGSSES